MTVDFLPERVTVGRAMRARIIRQGYLLGIMLCALACLAYFNDERIGKAEAQINALDSQSLDMTIRVKTMLELQGQLSDLMVKQRIDARLGSGATGMDVLGELARILPANIMLTSMELDTNQTPLVVKQTTGGVARAARTRGKTKTKMITRLKLTITGLSPNNVDVANFIADLSASLLFEDVDMGYAKNVKFRTKPAKEFQVSCYIVR
ncbi:MAG: PilN domain-containing protein [Phycisphaerales bacterium]|nr:PilN domain-containing protein [Phycisphaerales bacterium]